TFAELPDLVGREIGISPWVTIDQQMIDAFADATGDRQWIHVDRERAAREIGSTIAHGFLTLSLIPRLADPMLVVRGMAHKLNYGLNRVRFTQAVRPGQQVRLRQSATACETKGRGTQLTLECVFEIEGEARSACIAETLVLFMPETSEP
ncbi:MAG: MaoC family dehydratase, partial [Pseudomonadota bacterium]